MAESTIADFVAKFNSGLVTSPDPIKGRILLSTKRLVLALDDENKMTIPLPDVVDIAVGHVPENLGGFFESTVTVAFERGDVRDVAVIEADDEKIERFSTLLFRAILNDTKTMIEHPARIGGRVLDTAFRPAKLSVSANDVEFLTESGSVDIDLSTVVECGRSSRVVGDRSRDVLQVQHVRDGRSRMTMAVTDSDRKMSILGRFLRLEYSDLVGELHEIDLSSDQKEILIALYSGADETGNSLSRIVGLSPSEVTTLCTRLEDHGLVVDTPDGLTLTPRARVLVNRRLEDVDS